MKIGLAGLGVMGWRIGANLAKDGKLDIVYNRTDSKARQFSEKYGVQHAISVEELFQEADMIITMLSDDRAVQSFINKSLPLVKGKTIVDMSTISPSLSMELAQEVRNKGGMMYDAPVIGTSVFVEQRKLIVLLGGPQERAEEVSSVLSSTASQVLYIGPNGSGLYAKLVNNLMVGAYVASLAEAFNLGKSAGISDEVVSKILVNYGSVRSPTSEIKVPKLVSRDYETQFAVRHMRKDLEIISREAERLNIPNPMSSIALQLYRLAEMMGLSEMDYVSVYEIYTREKSKLA